MAARIARTAAPTVVRVVPSGVRRYAGQLARRGGAAAARQVAAEKHTLTAVGSGLVLGLMRAQGVQLPHIQQIGVPATYGIAAWALGRYTRSQVVQHVATGLLTIGAYELGSGLFGGGGGGAGPLPLVPPATPPAAPPAAPVRGYGGGVIMGDVIDGEL